MHTRSTASVEEFYHIGAGLSIASAMQLTKSESGCFFAAKSNIPKHRNPIKKISALRNDACNTGVKHFGQFRSRFAHNIINIAAVTFNLSAFNLVILLDAVALSELSLCLDSCLEDSFKRFGIGFINGFKYCGFIRR